MTNITALGAYHHNAELELISRLYRGGGQIDFTYNFENFFHPFVGQLIQQLNKTSVAKMLDHNFLSRWNIPYTNTDYDTSIASGSLFGNVLINLMPKVIDVTVGGPYANYNWELLYHIPVMIAIHLSNNQRFAEAQKWFHLVFDPTTQDSDTSPQRYWRSFALRAGANQPLNIDQLLALLSSTTASPDQAAIQQGYKAMLHDPFQPHAIARTRPSAYQWYVVMKYLDNLIAWGDSLFMQDTIETINEATLCYVLASNILGPRPQSLPAMGAVSPKNFAQLKQMGLDQMGNAVVDLEAQFPFNLTSGTGQAPGAGDQTGALLGIGRSLYFCIPQNQQLLAYWDTVADRLFKIRNSENILGVVQQLPLFDPPLDPGMLVKAAAAGLDIGSIVSGLNQPLGPVRSPLLIQKALEVAGEVRSLGNALLASFEKGDAEQLALLRQGHEIQLQQMVQNVRYLQWQHAQETTTGLLKTRASALERYTYYLRLLGLTPDSNSAPATFDFDRRELTEDNFDDAYNALVSKYDLTVSTQTFGKLQLVQVSSPSNQSGASGSGQLFLNTNEDVELNTHIPNAHSSRNTAMDSDRASSVAALLPDMGLDLHFWGLGGHMNVFGGSLLATAGRFYSSLKNTDAANEETQGSVAAKTASYQRRVDDWMLQSNLAARELMQIGRQILASLIAEQVAYHDYLNVKTQVQQAQDIQGFLQTKFTSAVFYSWMQSEISGLYYQYYRFACDTARKAEQTMKKELMRSELDATQFIQFNYWDSGHQGLLSGEALYLDIKRMELAYHDNNKRELELTRHVSLRQLDPLALLSLKITGSCTLTIPEWLFDRDCPGLYMRRIKSVSLSTPSVVGPYTSINCTLSLQSSSLRVSPLLSNGVYARDTTQDDIRFVDYFGGADLIVTSGGVNDSGMFDTNLKDERFLPFEGAGAISTWTLSLPRQLPAFDYMTISDVLLHMRYTARMAGDPLGAQAISELKAMFAAQGSQSLIFCLRYDFSTEWAAFVDPHATANFSVTLTPDLFPYFAQAAGNLTIDSISLYAADPAKPNNVLPDSPQPAQVGVSLPFTFLSAANAATLSLPADAVLTRDRSRQVFMIVGYHFGSGN